MKVNFNPSVFSRKVANAADLILRNRYFEENPSLTEDGSSLIARPGMRKLTEVGEGPIRGLKSEAGSFNGDLFVASGQELYRMTNTLEATEVYDNLSIPVTNPVKMAITALIGETPEYCFFADGTTLMVYLAEGYSNNTLSGSSADNDVISLDGVYYKWTFGSVDTGTPDGSSGSPYLVKWDVNSFISFENMRHAVNATGAPGTNYSSSLTTAHPTVEVNAITTTTMKVRARVAGPLSDTIPVTESGVGLSWVNGSTLVSGGDGQTLQVPMPDDVGVIDVAVVNSFVIVIPVQANGMQGRFYWIEPGEITVDPLNFATAERSPDGVYGVQVFGDQFWLPGESTTEVWYVSGGNPNDPTAPVVQRLQGVVLDRGSWQNTAAAIHETLILVDADGGVFAMKGGAPQRVSTPAIEEEIRKAIQLELGS